MKASIRSTLLCISLICVIAGALHFLLRPRPSVPSYAQVMREAGFRTAGYLGGSGSVVVVSWRSEPGGVLDARRQAFMKGLTSRGVRVESEIRMAPEDAMDGSGVPVPGLPASLQARASAGHAGVSALVSLVGPPQSRGNGGPLVVLGWGADMQREQVLPLIRTGAVAMAILPRADLELADAFSAASDERRFDEWYEVVTPESLDHAR
jgi:hypothetical protein